MRITKIHIRSYGNLTGKTVEFEPGITAIYESNGFGKSTIAAFIRAMLYGLGRSDCEERKKKPWNHSGSFGGYMEFETGGKLYRADRTFGNRESEDTFTLFRMPQAVVSNDFGKNLGSDIFKLDADAFLRSTFMPQESIKLEPNASITAKLTGLVEDSQDIGRYDKAVAALEKHKKLYDGNLGLIKETESRLKEAKQAAEICVSDGRQLKLVEEEMRTLTVKSRAAEEELKKIREKIKQSGQLEADRIKQEQLKKLISQDSKAQDEFQKVRDFFGGEPLQDKIITESEQAAYRLKELESGINAAKPNELLGQLKSKYRAVPAKEEIDSLLVDCEKLPLKRVEASEAAAVKTVTRNPLLITLLILAIGLIAGGIALFFVSWAVGAALAVSGIVLLLADMFLYYNQRFGKIKPAEGALTQEQLHLAMITEQKAEAFFAKCGTGAVYPYVAALSAIGRDISLIEELIAEQREKDIIAARLTAEHGSIVNELNGLLKAFGLSGDYLQAIYELKVKCREYHRCESEAKHTKSELEGFIRDKAIPQGFESVLLAVPESSLQQDEKRLTEQIDSALSELRRLKQRADIFRESYDKLEDRLQEAASLEIERQEYLHQHGVAVKAIEMLKAAHSRLSDSYGEKLAKSFAKYTGMLGGLGAAAIDKKLNIRIEKDEGLRDVDTYSAGYKDMISFCMRLSLADAMFPDEKPFLLLDDPFVNYDDDKLCRALDMLDKIKDEYQVIYFCCHRSRIRQ